MMATLLRLAGIRQGAHVAIWAAQLDLAVSAFALVGAVVLLVPVSVQLVLAVARRRWGRVQRFGVYRLVLSIVAIYCLASVDLSSTFGNVGGYPGERCSEGKESTDMATMTSSPAAAPTSAAPVTAATPASRRIRSSVPSTRVLHAINPFVSAILRSPVHRLLSKQVLLLTVRGRTSGKAYTLPVGYSREADTVTVLSGRHAWWKNLRGGAPVAVRLEGHRRTGRAEVIEDRAALLAEVDHLVAKYGRKGAGQRIGIALDTTPPPSQEDLARAMQGRAVIRLFLDGVPDRGGAWAAVGAPVHLTTAPSRR